MITPSKRLSFSEYIAELSPNQVFRDLVPERYEGRKIISSALIDSVTTEFTESNRLRKRFESLDDDLKSIIMTIYLSGSAGVFYKSNESLKHTLLHTFLVYGVTVDSKVRLFGFKDFDPILMECFAVICIEQSANDPKKQPFLLKQRCVNDCILIAVFALTGQLKRKQNGEFMQASLFSLKARMHGITETGTLTTAANDHTTIVSFLVDYGLSCGLLCEYERVITTTDAQIRKWLTNSPEEIYENISSYCRIFVTAYNENLLTLLTSKGDFAIDSLDNSGTNDITKSALIFYYCFIIGMNTVKKRKFLTSIGEMVDFNPIMVEQNILIMPDFTSVIPQEVLPEVLYSFTRVGIINSFDRVYNGQINKDCVYEALSHGLDASSLLGYLSLWKAPENIITTVSEWIREFSRLHVYDEPMLICGDESTSKQIEGLGLLKGCVEKVPIHSLYRIMPGCIGEVRSTLINAGFDTRTPYKQESLLSFAEKNDESSRSVVKKETVLITDFELLLEKNRKNIRGGKYSGEMKKLDLSEMFHVIDYAILMGSLLNFEYEGWANVRKGNYQLTPKMMKSDDETYLVEDRNDKKEPRKFYLKKISKIGVVE